MRIVHLFIFTINIINGFRINKYSKKILKMNSFSNEYANDLYNIQHYKNNADNLDYTTFMKILDRNEFSRIYIDNNPEQI